MIRLIFKHINGTYGSTENESMFTIDLKNKEVEAALTAGGYGEDGFEFVKLVGAEVIKEVKDD